MKRNFSTEYSHNGTIIPIRVSFEWRSNVRISLGRQNVNLRLPALISNHHLQKHLEWGKEWIDQQLLKNPQAIDRFKRTSYTDGQMLRVNGTDYTLKVSRADRKTLGAKLVGKVVHIYIPGDLDQPLANGQIPQLLSRVFSRHFLPEFDQRIRQINQQYFREPIGQIRFKYNKSNWGSCSAKGNINISTRLLFAPHAVQDYVLVHELAHLKELNHSPRFWQIVASIVPDYRQKEKWLKANSHHMDF